MDYEKLRELRNKQNRFGDLAGVRIVEIREGYARTELEVKPEFLNPIGSVHGGCLFTMADITGGSAAVSHGEQVTTADADIRYLRPGINVKKTDGRIQGDQEREKSSCISGRSPR